MAEVKIFYQWENGLLANCNVSDKKTVISDTARDKLTQFRIGVNVERSV